jgi:hypothetical protein
MKDALANGAHPVFVLENEAPLLRLATWALREEGFHVVSAPLPTETPRFGDQAPSDVIINCHLTVEECRAAVAAIRAAVPRVRVIDLGHHDGEDCGADHRVPPPYAIADIVGCLTPRD